MKYLGAVFLTLFLLGEMFDWFVPLDSADSPGIMRNISAKSLRDDSGGVLFFGSGTHRGK